MKLLALIALTLFLRPACVAQETQRNGSANRQGGAASVPQFVYVDGTIFQTVQSAIDSLGKSPGIVIINDNYRGQNPVFLPGNVTIWDLRSGRLKIITNPDDTAEGTAASLWVGAGPLGFSDNVPAKNDTVGIYAAVRAPAGHATWGENVVVDLAADKPDVNLWGLEIDLAAQGTDRKGQYIGLDVVSSAALGATPLTAAVRAYTANTNAAGWRKGFDVRGVIDCAFCVEGIEPGLTITQAITGRSSPQTVPTTAAAGITEIFVGALMSVDSGPDHEDVRVTSLAGIQYSITGVFTKSHKKGTGFTVYSGDRLLEFGDAVTAKYPYHIGSLRAYKDSHTSNVLGFSVNDESGAERLTWFFPAETSTQTWRDVGGGFAWQDSAGVQTTALNGKGTLTVYNGITTAGSGVPAIYGTPIQESNLDRDFGPATIYTTPGSSGGSGGFYRVCVNAWTTVAGSGRPLTIQVIYNNGASQITQPLEPTLPLDRLSMPVSACLPIHSAAGQRIQIEARGKQYGTSRYSIDATVEQLR